MINLIVWSKDRACQLHLLLESIKKNAPVFKTSIIYKTSNEDYLKGYQKLMGLFPDSNFIVEEDMTQQTRELVKEDFSHVCFSTDDQVFYRPMPCNPEHALPRQDGEIFSFRLGYNTIVQNCHTGDLQTPLNKVSKVEDFIFWCANSYHPFSNYGYPLALDTHVFTRSFADWLIHAINWRTTNELESGWQHRDIRGRALFMCSYKKSISVNIPMNNHSQITRHGETHGYSTEFLNESYLNGDVIDLEAIGRESIVGCHQEIPLKFRKL